MIEEFPFGTIVKLDDKHGIIPNWLGTNMPDKTYVAIFGDTGHPVIADKSWLSKCNDNCEKCKDRFICFTTKPDSRNPWDT